MKEEGGKERKNNEGKKNLLKFFEIAKIYKKRLNDLPKESYRLGIVTNTSFFDLKGIVDSLLRELNITNVTIRKSTYNFLGANLQGEIFAGKDWLVKYGELSKQQQMNYQIKDKLFLALFDFKSLIKNYQPLSRYHPINPYAVIKLDQTFANSTYEVVQKAAEKSKLLQKTEVVSIFKDKFTLRFYFSSNSKNIREDEAKKELEKIKELVSE